MSNFILDVVNGAIHFNEYEIELLNTPTLRRLQYIRQLEFISLVYPGCNHTRFEHTIGVTYLLKCITENESILNDFLIPSVKKFLEDNNEDNNKDALIDKVNEQFIKTLLPLIGMLHDIGHGPFSHFSESIFELIGLPRPTIHDPGEFEKFSNDNKLKLHEWIMYQILTIDIDCKRQFQYLKGRLNECFKKDFNLDKKDNKTLKQLCKFLKERHDDIRPPIEKAIKSLGLAEKEEVDTFLKLIAYGACGKIPGIDSFIYGIFDLDRLDYLRRDSKMAGVKYGDVEVNRLLTRGITFDKNIPHNLLIDHAKGIAALEHIYLGKDMLYSTTIFHPCSATAKKMLLKFILELLKKRKIIVINNDEISVSEWNEVFKFLIKVYSMEDPDFIEFLKEEAQTYNLEEVHYLQEVLNRDLYKKVAVFHWTDLHPNVREEIIELSKHENGFAKIWGKSCEYEKKIGMDIKNILDNSSLQNPVIVNLPFYKKEWADIHWAIIKKKGVLESPVYEQATEVSPLLEASQKSIETAKIVSVYLNPQLSSQIESDQKKKRKVLKIIHNYFSKGVST